VTRPLAVVPFQEADTVASCIALTGDTVAVKVALLAAAKTVTAGGTENAVLLEERATLMFVDVAVDSVTVHAVDFPATTDGLQASVLTVCARLAIESR